MRSATTEVQAQSAGRDDTRSVDALLHYLGADEGRERQTDRRDTSADDNPSPAEIAAALRTVSILRRKRINQPPRQTVAANHS